ncbi:MAG TPA: 3-methyl-2-oxobutanoate hydroxymethyltransferase [Longimicrobiales bacterium]|nr:3-methyl-2-oxobutanoate hydroxymethyltransferase [Longimicrobiales bacterium]
MSSETPDSPRRVTTRTLLLMKEAGERIVCLTAYDALFGRILDEAGVDVVLVGDSLGQVVCGFDSTIPVTLDAMVHHAAAARRGVRNALLVVDMPFLTFQVSPEETLRNAGRVMRETGAEAIKLEGGGDAVIPHVRKLVAAGIPVMGHVGLTPQSVHALGGYRVQGRGEENAARIAAEAEALADAGCFAIVLELVPRDVAARITASVAVPTIGIGAGPDVDGQVLVLHDMLGLNEAFEPRFLRRFGSLGRDARAAVAAYADAVRAGEYPADEHSF